MSKAKTPDYRLGVYKRELLRAAERLKSISILTEVGRYAAEKGMRSIKARAKKSDIEIDLTNLFIHMQDIDRAVRQEEKEAQRAAKLTKLRARAIRRIQGKAKP